MSIFYLYVKTHNITGLKYLGQTKQNPYKYQGSGVRWLNHLKVHGNNVNTEIIAAFDNRDDLREAGIFHSTLWNVVDSKEWANLMEEKGNGGFASDIPWNKGKKGVQVAWNKGVPFSKEHKHKLKGPRPSLLGNQNRTGSKHSEDAKTTMSLAHFGSKNHFYGKHHTEEARQKIKETRTKQIITEEHKRKISEGMKNYFACRI